MTANPGLSNPRQMLFCFQEHANVFWRTCRTGCVFFLFPLLSTFFLSLGLLIPVATLDVFPPRPRVLAERENNHKKEKFRSVLMMLALPLEQASKFVPNEPRERKREKFFPFLKPLIINLCPPFSSTIIRVKSFLFRSLSLGYPVIDSLFCPVARNFGDTVRE